MIALTLALVAGAVHAQQAANSADTDNFSVQAPVKKIIPPKMLNQQLIHLSLPEYPDAEFTEEARAKRVNGRCLISFTVDVNGMPQEIKPVRCSDFSFAKSSVASVAKYRFKPATTEDGDPVDYHESVEIDYILRDGSCQKGSGNNRMSVSKVGNNQELPLKNSSWKTVKNCQKLVAARMPSTTTSPIVSQPPLFRPRRYSCHHPPNCAHNPSPTVKNQIVYPIHRTGWNTCLTSCIWLNSRSLNRGEPSGKVKFPRKEISAVLTR